MPADSTLKPLLTTKAVRALADPGSFQRGQRYAAQGRVQSLVLRGDALTAIVTGSRDYTVTLKGDAKRLSHRCSCPVGLDGAFCKHAVAVALAWMNEAATEAPDSESDPDAITAVRLDDLRPWLSQQPSAKLAEWLLEAATHDERLRERLLRETARATSKGLDFAAYRKAVDRATRTSDFIHYGEASGYAEKVREAIEPWPELITEGHAAAVIDLAEHTLTRVESAMEQADDSDGDLGSLLSTLQDLHLEACCAAHPDPTALAARLFEREVSGQWEVFYGAAETYADVLGPAGLAVYRAKAEAAWQSLPALQPGDQEDYDSRRFRVTSIMEALARVSGDLDALIAIKVKNLSHAYAFLTIAELLRDAQRVDEALEWAERGLRAFAASPDPRLVEFTADIYHRRKRHDEAMALVWEVFAARPSVEGYQNLRSHAERAKAWPQSRERALALLRARIANTGPGRRTRPHAWEIAADRSTLVRIFLDEKDVEAAWREAHTGDIARELWLELAEAREPTHPEDALPILIRAAESAIAQTNRPGYELAVHHLRKIRALYRRVDRTADWESLIGRLRQGHKAKRNFIALAAAL